LANAPYEVDMSQNLMSVSSLNTKIKSLLEATFMHVMVEGEVSQVTYASSGHVYFTIKDNQSNLKCVMWRSSVAKMKFRLEQGEHVVVEGSISVYAPRGEYQMIATHVEPYGKGTLAVAYEQLKSKLQEKGYFDPKSKKTLPKYPRKIALVTAATSAALQDMLKVATKRWALSELVVVDVLVQGELAAGEIARAIAYADTLSADIIVAGRGGGSMEDLWAFNEEIVADAIFAASTPVVSAVGHEVDTLISDFVADLRAPTPSAAMEMILPDSNEMLQMIDDKIAQAQRLIRDSMDKKTTQADTLAHHFAQRSPVRQLRQLKDRFDDIEDELTRTFAYRLDKYQGLTTPIIRQLSESIHFVLRRNTAQVAGDKQRLETLDPKKRSKDGFAEITRDGKRISLGEINVGDVFDLSTDRYKISAKSLEKSEIRN
jgi:exodeoxyribonuclease VII large subunit